MSSTQKAVAVGAAAVVGGVAMMAKSAINAAAEFESSMNVLRSVSGATGEQMQALSKQARQLGADTKLPGTSAKDAAEAMVELSKAGLTVVETQKAVRSTLLLSAAAGVSNSRAAEIASNALNAFGLDASRTGKVVDMLANAANASSLEIEDAADSMKMAGAVFKGLQGPAVGAEQALKDLTTATAILGNAGIKGSDAGTSLKQTLLSLASPSEKTKDAMRALYISAQSTGVSFAQLTAIQRGGAKVRGEMLTQMEKQAKMSGEVGDIAFDEAGRMRSLKEIIGLVAAGTREMTQEQRAFYITQIFGADASRAVIALLDQQAKGWDEMAGKIDKNGAAQALADAKMKGLKGTMEALRSAVETLQVEFGLMLLPAVTKVMQAVVKATEFIGKHKTATGIVTVAVTAFAVALGTAAAASALMSSTLVATVIPAILKFIFVQQAANGALSANPIGIVIMALAALAAGIVIAYNKSETFRAIVDGLWAKLKSLGGWMREHFPAAKEAFLKALEPVVALFKTWWNVIQNIIDGAKWLIENLGKITGSVVDAARGRAQQEFGPGGTGDANLMGASPVMSPFAAAGIAHGLQVTSGLRPGARTRHGTLSDHAVGKALDLAGPASSMAAFFKALVGNAAVKQAFYDPLGSIFGGAWSSYREGGHSDHVHVATYDQGGILRPGLTMAWNGTGRNEYVGGGNVTIPVSIGGEHIFTIMWDQLRQRAAVHERRNGRSAF